MSAVFYVYRIFLKNQRNRRAQAARFLQFASPLAQTAVFVLLLFFEKILVCFSQKIKDNVTDNVIDVCGSSLRYANLILNKLFGNSRDYKSKQVGHASTIVLNKKCN